MTLQKRWTAGSGIGTDAGIDTYRIPSALDAWST
jgi:hypothetical protein